MRLVETMRHLARSISPCRALATTNCARRWLSSVTCAPDTTIRRVCRHVRRVQQYAFNLRIFSALRKRFCNGAYNNEQQGRPGKKIFNWEKDGHSWHWSRNHLYRNVQ